MSDEIGKFEVEKEVSDAWKPGDGGTPYRQGYLSTEARTVRVRLQGQQGKLTINGEKVGSTAPEFEYDIPTKDANFLLVLLGRPLSPLDPGLSAHHPEARAESSAVDA